MSKTGGGENFHYLTIVKYDRHLRDRYARSSVNHSLVDLNNRSDRKGFLLYPRTPGILCKYIICYMKPPVGEGAGVVVMLAYFGNLGKMATLCRTHFLTPDLLVILLYETA